LSAQHQSPAWPDVLGPPYRRALAFLGSGSASSSISAAESAPRNRRPCNTRSRRSKWNFAANPLCRSDALAGGVTRSHRCTGRTAWHPTHRCWQSRTSNRSRSMSDQQEPSLHKCEIVSQGERLWLVWNSGSGSAIEPPGVEPAASGSPQGASRVYYLFGAATRTLPAMTSGMPLTNSRTFSRIQVAAISLEASASSALSNTRTLMSTSGPPSSK
jgi:hypothetical protein